MKDQYRGDIFAGAASTSKYITAVLVLHFVQKGIINLD